RDAARAHPSADRPHVGDRDGRPGAARSLHGVARRGSGEEVKLGLVCALAAACTPEFEPQGAHHKYVVATVALPATPQEASSFAVLLGNQRANAFGAAI